MHLDTKSLTNSNMNAGTVTLLMQGPTPPLRPKLASPQPTQECKQVSQHQSRVTTKKNIFLPLVTAINYVHRVVLNTKNLSYVRIFCTVDLV